MTELQGLYTALATPFGENDAIDIGSLNTLVDFVLAQNLEGIYVGGSTGEALLLDAEERETILREVLAQCQGNARVIGQVGSLSTRESTRLAEFCAREGCAAVSAIPPIYFPYKSEDIVSYYKDIASAAGDIPVIVYNVPAMSDVHFSMDDIRTLLSIDNVVGIKQTVADMYQMERIHRLFPDAVLLNGYDETFLFGILAGAVGGIGSTYNIMGWRYRQILTLCREGRNTEALQLQSKCNAIIDLLVEAGVFPGIKYILHRMGIIASPRSRKPLTAVDEKYHDALDQIAATLLDENRALLG